MSILPARLGTQKLWMTSALFTTYSTARPDRNAGLVGRLEARLALVVEIDDAPPPLLAYDLDAEPAGGAASGPCTIRKP